MAYSDKDIVLITGGNGGIGLEVARQLTRDHGKRFHVLVGCRSLSDGEAAVKRLQEEDGVGEGVEAIQIDITSEESLAAAAKQVGDKFGRLDVLHANAGISGDQTYAGRPIGEVITLTVATNAAGAAASVEHFVPLLSRAKNPRVVFMSSGAGSLKLAHDFAFVKDYPAYSVSKAAENMVMLYYHHRFPGWKVNASNPGFRATKINNYGQGSKETPGPVSEGAMNAVRLTLLGEDGESGTHTMIQASQDEYSKTMEGKNNIVTVPW
ncbi:hypothetical protein KVR01_009267 [Diaporthe batatas]|uniref:uncharacterized protein n=1 Tax=Diaporthe batatas TaxID=748121 RepID=UPI001D03B545|nr:uncharacterized protein KVR01_009267 [Diaporthe batatas]KAG8161003.1 hypothetical protein KVR01_009267 [Diaporthe batatas]